MSNILPKRMFSYGTLSSLKLIERHWGSWTAGLFKKSKASKGTVAGILYQGKYPSLKKGSGSVHGTLYDFTDLPDKDWEDVVKTVDYIESNGSYYTRKVAQVNTKSGVVEAWVYFFNHKCSEENLVKSGRYEDISF